MPQPVTRAAPALTLCFRFAQVCDDFDQIALWNFDSGKKELSFSNCNKNGSRMTSVKWLNDSILAVGCCDGTVRLWDSVINRCVRERAKRAH